MSRKFITVPILLLCSSILCSSAKGDDMTYDATRILRKCEDILGPIGYPSENQPSPSCAAGTCEHIWEQCVTKEMSCGCTDECKLRSPESKHCGNDVNYTCCDEKLPDCTSPIGGMPYCCKRNCPGIPNGITCGDYCCDPYKGEQCPGKPINKDDKSEQWGCDTRCQGSYHPCAVSKKDYTKESEFKGKTCCPKEQICLEDDNRGAVCGLGPLCKSDQKVCKAFLPIPNEYVETSNGLKEVIVYETKCCDKDDPCKSTKDGVGVDCS